MRDLETVEAALRISETGHLCLATLHTQSAIQSITRIIDMFPVHLRNQIRVQLSFTLQGVLSQRLIPRLGVKGRALAAEVMMMNQAIRHLIRDDKLPNLRTTSAWTRSIGDDDHESESRCTLQDETNLPR